MTGELTQYRLVQYVHGMTYNLAGHLLRKRGWTSFDEVDAWIDESPRRQADQCCDICRKRPGRGPWCGRCGRENQHGERVEGTWFRDECPVCVWGLPTGWPAPVGGAA